MKPSGARTRPLGNRLELHSSVVERGYVSHANHRVTEGGSNPRSSEAQSTDYCFWCHPVLQNRLR